MDIGRNFLYDIWNTTKESSWESLEGNLRQRWNQSRGVEANLLERLLRFTGKMYYSKEEFPKYFESFFQMIRERA